MSKDDKVFVAGHKGLVGGEILRALAARGYKNIVTRDRKELNLMKATEVHAFYEQEQPDVVFVAAAKVGGIHANNTYPADYIFENLQIQNNLIWGAHKADVKRLVFLGSSCIYPRACPQPMKEEHLLTGVLEHTNRPYALAKIAGLELVNALYRQHGRDYFSVMPTNLYGPRDNFHPENSHVVPALIRRFCEAVDTKALDVTIWGTGTPKRELMYAADCADAIVHLAETIDQAALGGASFKGSTWNHVNVGSGDEVSIADLARLIAEVADYKGVVKFDTSKLDGTPRKLLDTSLLKELGWKRKVSLAEGLKSSIDWFRTSVKTPDAVKG